ncbi:MAG: hypothetical protein LBR29_07950, partial [Methylobacteriaceae bacterium]|nr:hypothetical protein [Methylobacteriaceae bacterium]
MIYKDDNPSAMCRLILTPGRAENLKLQQLFKAYQLFFEWLDQEVPPNHSNDLVALHRNFYDAARARSGLPAQIVTLGFRDWALRRRGSIVSGIPLDPRLYSVKTVSTLSVSGLNGRILVSFVVGGYDVVLPPNSPARLMQVDNHFEIWAETALPGEQSLP